MDDDWLPWIDYPDLTRQRLLVIGDLIRQAREGAADDHHPEKYETNLTLGISGFERTRGTLSWARSRLPWLTVVSGSEGGPVPFVFAVGRHPLRLYPGDPDEVPDRYSQKTFPEEWQNAQARKWGLEPCDGLCLRIAIPHTHDGRPDRIYLVEFDEEAQAVRRMYLIPRVAGSGTVTDFTPPLVPPVEIPKVQAEPVDDLGVPERGGKTGSNDE